MIMCDPECWERKTCPKCGKEVPPHGRSIPMEATDSYCEGGHMTHHRHLWDIHDYTRYYTDPEGWAQHVSICLACSTPQYYSRSRPMDD